MIRKLNYIAPWSVILFFLFSCGGGSDGDSSNPEPMAPAPVPEAVTLIFPENNTECNISEVLSETQSIVPFDWNPSENTDTYQITVRNLNTNFVVSNAVVTVPEANITLERGTPYEWSVESRANGTNETASSPIFRFFNEGPGIENFAPFPANAINPRPGSNFNMSVSNISLEWTANDIDNDILDFDVFFGTDENSLELLSTTTNTVIEASVSSGETYFWSVVTRDRANNSSQSPVFQFRIN